MRKNFLIGIAALFLLALFMGVSQANLIENASFEEVSGTFGGQGALPDNWIVTNYTPDTYSNDGSWGFAPNAYDNFTGVTAYDGIRWVAGWSSYSESFGQYLTSNLVDGTEYEFSGWLHQAHRSDLNNPGGYDIYLGASAGTKDVYLGSIGNTDSYADGWNEYLFNFTATEQMSVFNFLEFVPTGSSAYPGLDLVSLTASIPSPPPPGPAPVPEPSTWLLLGTGLAGLAIYRRKKS